MGVDLASFAREVGDESAEPVWIIGHQSRTAAPPAVRRVVAPSGIIDLQPDEMTVVCGAGTTIDELQGELDRVGQYVNLPGSTSGSGTVGGALAQGTGDIYRLGRGAVRDVLLQVRFVGHDGNIVMAGGPTVKNVSGFDLCRLMVGSRGVLGFMGEVILRTRPKPRSSRWFFIEDANYLTVELLLQRVYRPASVLWNGRSTWFCIEGHPKDCDATIAHLEPELGSIVEVSGPPDLTDYPFRQSVSPKNIESSPTLGTNEFVVEAGVGVVHVRTPIEQAPMDAVLGQLHGRLLNEFNPSGRLNPGVSLVG